MQWLTPHTPHVNFTARAECGFIAFMMGASPGMRTYPGRTMSRPAGTNKNAAVA